MRQQEPDITRFALSLSLIALGHAQSPEQFANAHLPKGMELAHPVVAGSFGPPGPHIIMLYRADGDDGEFKGVVYLEAKRASALPALGLIPNQFAIEVKSVFFKKVAVSEQPELFILYGYHRNGSQSDDGHACAVYRWINNNFVRDTTLEKNAVNLATAAVVRQCLHQSNPKSNSPSGEPKQ